MKIGFIGIGVMGKPMSINLLKKSGFPLFVFDINNEAVNELVELGAKKSRCVSDIASVCDVIFTMLPRDAQVQSVYDEMLPMVKPGQIYIDMSTISPNVSRNIAKKIESKGGDMLDAPVVKSRQAAVDGVLGIYVGGSNEIFKEMLPLLSCMGSGIIRLGEHGAGLVMKLCHNMLVGQIQNGVNEMLFLADKAADIDVETFAQAVAYGGGKNFYLESKLETLKQMDFTAAFATEYMHKDVYLAKALCEDNGVCLEGVELVAQRYTAAIEKGYAKEDFSSTYKLFAGK